MNRLGPLLEMLGRPLLLVVLVLAVGGSLVWWTAQRSAEARQSEVRERSALDQVRQRLAQVGEEKRLIERYAPAYRRLQQEGIVGAEQRVNWIDALRSASHVVRGFGVDYQVGGQEGAGFKADAGGYALQQSVMKLRLRLLHERDLLDFLAALDAEPLGLHLLQGCELQRASGGPFTARFEPKLLAECQLTWITLDDRVLKGEP
jgi:hypothetical protein